MFKACNFMGPYVPVLFNIPIPRYNAIPPTINATEFHPIVTDSRGTAGIAQETLSSQDGLLPIVFLGLANYFSCLLYVHQPLGVSGG